MRVGASSASPSVRSPVTPGTGRVRSAPDTSRIRRISEKPFECGPLDARPSSTSPAAMRAPVDRPRLLDDADGEAGEVVFAVGVHAGHLGRLAADQRAAGLLAARGDALDHQRRGGDVEPPAGEIVEEEQRLRALHEDVVGAHRDQVDADGVVPVERERELELGADAVGAGDQHRLAEALADLDQRAEAADAGEHLGAHRPLGERLDALDQRVAGVDVDARLAVRQRSRGWGDGGEEGGRLIAA